MWGLQYLYAQKFCVTYFLNDLLMLRSALVLHAFSFLHSNFPVTVEISESKK